MSRFGADPHAFFTRVYADVAPWEIGDAQPDMARLLAAYPPADPVLDLGSATGDLAIYLANLGHEVIGLEFVAAAVEQARAKISRLPAESAARLRFVTGDATRPSSLGIPLGAAVDSGFLHLLDPAATDLFIADLARAIAPGGRYYLHEFAVEFPIDNVPRAVTEEEIETRFSLASGWRLLEMRRAEFFNRVAQPTPAVIACAERV